MNIWKKSLPDVLAILLFAVLSFAYFFPADIEGRILYQNDHAAGKGMGVEQQEYYERTGERTRWTNAIFSGMPTYQTSPSYDSGTVLNHLSSLSHLWLPGEMGYVFLYLFGFYILLRAFNFRQSLAALGSIIWAFSSYFFIIIAAGHIWKVWALGFLPPMIAGIVLAYRGRYLWGLLVTALFTGLEVHANHVQMTYYYLFVVLFMFIAFLIDAALKHEWKRFGKATAACLVGAVIGVSLNISNLYHTWQYGKESMRGKSELVKKDVAKDNQTDSGLERDYITMWSYGIDETWSLLVPNVKGGASVPMVRSKKAMEKADNTYLPVYQQIGQYWGEQPGTSGPVYVGAFVLMLFILGLFIVKGPMKWALLAATILSILLAWGRNFMDFTNFFIDYMPMYSKFRTVASILVIAEFTIPLLAMLALKRIIEEPELLKRKMRYVYVSFGLTAGFCLLFALMPGVFFPNYVSSSEMQALSQIPAEQLQPLLANLTEMRKAVFTADCWRSFWIIVVGTLLLLLFKAGKLKAAYTIAGITLLCLVDMWTVNKRYLNDEMFVEKSVRDNPVQPTETEKEILKDKSLDYRVLNLASNTFNENETSYYFKSIGGYHPAKLRRYQEMIEAHISPEMQGLMSAVAQAGGDMTKVNGDSIFPVLNMLNAKYFILPLQNGQTVPVQNPYTYGNAWFVDSVRYVDNANEELDLVGKMDLRHEAVADKKFSSALRQSKRQGVVGAFASNATSGGVVGAFASNATSGNATSGVVTIKTYEPNRLTYDVNSDTGGVVVFSEVYYPEWVAKVDGKEVPMGRVNYILRAINVGPGHHTVELSFFPKSVATTETIAYIGYAFLLLVLALIAALGLRKRKA